MARLFAGAYALVVVLGACGAVKSEGDRHVGGNVRGLWDGADGVVLELEADGAHTLLTASANGMFSFPKPLGSGTLYTVTVATSPASHSCVVDAGGNGTVADVDIMNVSVACSGPVMAIELSGQWGSTFDATKDTQTFAGSIVVQDVAVTVSGSSLSSATVNGTAVSLGKQTALLALPLGMTTVPVALTAGGGLSKTYQLVFDRGGSVLDQVVYGKASNTGASDQFGYSIALSGDTLAVGAPQESSAATGVNGNQTDNAAGLAGAVYVFVRTGTTWTQQAYIKASNTEYGDYFGWSVALSGDTLAVGAFGEDSAAIGVNGNQADNAASSSGAAYVFVRNGTTWTQQAYVKASNPGASDYFGWSVALSGNTLAVGAYLEDSSAVGLNGNQADSTTAVDSGAAYVFVRTGTTWAQQAYVKASNTGASDSFGRSVALSGDTLAVGAYAEDSAAAVVNGNQADNVATDAGAVYVFFRNGATWVQQAYVKASNSGGGDLFGYSVALSGDTLSIGAYGEDSAATGVNGDQSNNAAANSGAAYVFVRNGTMWAQQAYVKASNPGVSDYFGYSIALSGDTLAVGAYVEDSAATGVNGNQGDNAAVSSGAAYVFVRIGTTWAQHAYVKASNTGPSDQFGYSVALSGETLAAGAYLETSSAVGVNPVNGQTDNGVASAGAIYLFH
jgi:hypothetical protein